MISWSFIVGYNFFSLLQGMDLYFIKKYFAAKIHGVKEALKDLMIL